MGTQLSVVKELIFYNDSSATKCPVCIHIRFVSNGVQYVL